MNDKFKYHWLTKIFNLYIYNYTVGHYQFFILNGYSSYITPEFD